MANKVTIIIPCRNEENYISDVISNIKEQDYPADSIEIIIVDGESDDETQSIINDFLVDNKNIKFLVNPKKIVPFALNMALKIAQGDIIVRMDAHSVYPLDYISQLVFYSNRLNAENVGGVWETIPSNSSFKAKAIALATSNSFGIGDAKYRLKPKEIIEVDTVPFGCYKKSVFDNIGLFDEDLVRNQDDEFNARLIQNGGKIFLIPSIKIQYYARENFKKMFKMFFQYGLFKPLVNKKLKKPATIRQFVPLFFVIYLFLLLLTPILFRKDLVSLFAIPIVLYLLINLCVSIAVSSKEKNYRLIPYLIVSFFLTHFAYGYGYLYGILKFQVFNSRNISTEIIPNR